MQTECAEYSIGDLAGLYGVSLRTLRFYEDKALLRPMRAGFRRIYSEKDRLRLEIVLLARRLGFSLAEICELLEMRGGPEDGSPVSVDTLGLTKQQIRGQIDRLAEERARVQAAIEELRATASRLEHDPSGDRTLPLTVRPRAGRAAVSSRRA